MNYTYEQRTGRFLNLDGTLLATGYSGHDSGVNEPMAEDERGVGPIPRGEWHLGDPVNSPHTGPVSIPLTPVGHDAHGRSAFLIHGDNRAMNRTASRGCIILPRSARNQIVKSGVRKLLVVEG